MELKPYKEKKVKDQTYVIENLNGSFLINDQHKGLILLNNDLEKIKTITSFDAITSSDALLIEHVYKKFDNKAVLLDCYENEMLALVDLTTDKVTFIENKNRIIFFDRVYSWREALILSTYDGEFYLIDETKKQFINLSDDEVNSYDPLLIDFYEVVACNKVRSSCSAQYQFIFESYDDQIIGFYSMKDDIEVTIPYYDWKDAGRYGYTTKHFGLYYVNPDIFILIDRDRIEIRKDHHKAFIYPPEWPSRRFTFTHPTISFVDDHPYFTIIAYDKSSIKKSRLRQYRIPEKFMQ